MCPLVSSAGMCARLNIPFNAVLSARVLKCKPSTYRVNSIVTPNMVRNMQYVVSYPRCEGSSSRKLPNEFFTSFELLFYVNALCLLITSFHGFHLFPSLHKCRPTGRGISFSCIVENPCDQALTTVPKCQASHFCIFLLRNTLLFG